MPPSILNPQSSTLNPQASTLNLTKGVVEGASDHFVSANILGNQQLTVPP